MNALNGSAYKSLISDDMLFYDCEIANCIGETEGYQSCAGWGDFKGMGIAVVRTYTREFGFKAFLEKDLTELRYLIGHHREIIGFNSLNFDDALLAANGVDISTTYDLLREVRLASGQPPYYVRGVTRAGYNLNALAHANLDIAKTGSGELAPILWQDGKRQEVIDYCLQDVKLLIELFGKRDALTDPTDGSTLKLSSPPSLIKNLDEIPW